VANGPNIFQMLLVFPCRCMGRVISDVCDFVCLFVCSVHKKAKLSIANLVDIQCMAVARQALTLRSKGQGRTNVLPAWVCMLISLRRFFSLLMASEMAYDWKECH